LVTIAPKFYYIRSDNYLANQRAGPASPEHGHVYRHYPAYAQSNPEKRVKAKIDITKPLALQKSSLKRPT
jgi:hypothetical protein